jgi:hypothetical protein
MLLVEFNAIYRQKHSVGVAICICQFFGSEREIMLAIEGSMVARFTIAAAGEGCMVAAAGKGFKVEGEEKD